MNEVLLKVPFLRTVVVIPVELIATDSIHVEAVDDMARAAYSYRQCGASVPGRQGWLLPSICTSMPSWGMRRRRNRGSGGCEDCRCRPWSEFGAPWDSGRCSRAPAELGEMSVVGPRIAVAGQLHHGSCSGFGNGVVGPTAPVPVGQCGGTALAVSREEALGVTLAHSHDLGCLGDGKLVFRTLLRT